MILTRNFTNSETLHEEEDDEMMMMDDDDDDDDVGCHSR
jgi:hypothetical protein